LGFLIKLKIKILKEQMKQFYKQRKQQKASRTRADTGSGSSELEAVDFPKQW
jgi:hypothetical protein